MGRKRYRARDEGAPPTTRKKKHALMLFKDRARLFPFLFFFFLPIYLLRAVGIDLSAALAALADTLSADLPHRSVPTLPLSRRPKSPPPPPPSLNKQTIKQKKKESDMTTATPDREGAP